MNNKKLLISIFILIAVILIVLAIFFFQGFNKKPSNLEELENSEVQNFLTGKIIQEKQTLAVYPESERISIQKGGSLQGFAFSVINNDKDSKDFKYKIEADYKFDFSKCKNFSLQKANSYIQKDVQEFNLEKKGYLEKPISVLFSVPSNAPSCEIPYKLLIHYKNGDTWYPYTSKIIYLEIK